MLNKNNFVLLGALLFTWFSAQADTPYWPQPLSAYAGDDSVCIAIYSENSGQYLVHNMEQCQQRLSPCSTFKIPNTLIGLESGVLSGAEDSKQWDGTVHSRKVLNEDHDLSSAIKFSVVWYFQDVALDVGPDRMQAALDSYDYGNRDISGGQDHFWLSSSLQISALEQIRFMRALDRTELAASPANQQALTALMLQDYRLPEDFEGELYGKTGSCIGGEVDHGWFAGFLHRGEDAFTFAVNIKGEGKMGWDARKIILRVLQDMR